MTVLIEWSKRVSLMSRGLKETKAALTILGRRAPSSVRLQCHEAGVFLVCLRTGKEARWCSRIGKEQLIEQRTGNAEL